MGYFAIDGDTHMNEPHDVWLTRTPSHLHDRVPRVERRETAARCGSTRAASACAR